MLRIVARFKIMGNFDPAEITTLMGIKPSETYRKGQLILGTAMRYKTDGWILNSGADRDAGLDEQLNSLLQKVKSIEKQLADLPAAVQRETSCIVYTSSPGPVIHFSNAVIQQIASVAGCLEVGVSIVPDEPRPNVHQYS